MKGSTRHSECTRRAKACVVLTVVHAPCVTPGGISVQVILILRVALYVHGTWNAPIANARSRITETLFNLSFLANNVVADIADHDACNDRVTFTSGSLRT